ncbi:cellulose biosynthesis protein BcsP [Paraburkholderia sp. BL21I4N1]|uniref:cellulose biosynthesis protein BcsP n=1 Tax=Paraburkholderia sp. BL21I4N1 TaxID=1938801 RepID=UPI000CFC8C76|nr:cellulose biosynthesis protein BcsP [Paraburkholderia sp. BL21I4N1]PQV49734.1 cellulose biosynthesis protein BcsR [Paraburkholderia sp. BL21I4N1]
MSSSSDIEKLFDHFGGDANAYQEIGRENEARSARTRWPLLVTLDLSQPTIPAIGQRVARAQPPVAATPLAADPQDTPPKDAASVTRAKAPLFTRSHRRDIPPVAVAAAPSNAPRGASRFGELELPETVAKIDAVTPVAPTVARVDAVAAEVVPAAQAATPIASAPVAAVQYRAPVSQPIPPSPPVAPTWTQPVAAAPAAPASILGKLFALEPAATPPQPAASQTAAAPLHSVFDRLRGTPAQPVAAPVSTTRAAAPAPSNSWLVNGPRRS